MTTLCIGSSTKKLDDGRGFKSIIDVHLLFPNLKNTLTYFQLFGRFQRAWVQARNLLKFEGLEAFNARAENAKLYQGKLYD